MMPYYFIENLREICSKEKNKQDKLKVLFEERNNLQKIVFTETLTEPFPIYTRDLSKISYTVTSRRRIFNKELESYKKLLEAVDKLIEEIKLTVPDDRNEEIDDIFKEIDLSTDPSFSKKKGNLTSTILKMVDIWLDSGKEFTGKENEIFNLSLKIKNQFDEKNIKYSKETFRHTLKRILNNKRLFEKILKEFVVKKNYDFQSFKKRVKENSIPFSKSYIEKRFKKCTANIITD